MSNIAVGHAMRRRLPAMEKWLLVVLSEYADDWGDSVFPGLDELAEKGGMSRSTAKRTLAELDRRVEIIRVADATPVSPAFYRIVCVPEPGVDQDARAAQLCVALRRAAIHVFKAICEYCQRPGTKELGPDDKVWVIDRIQSNYRGGGYVPDNVTLACRACTTRGKAKRTPALVRTLAIAQEMQGIQPDTSPGSNVNQEGIQPDPSPGSNVNPDPVTDPVSDPVPIGKKQGLRPTRGADGNETPLENVGVIAKLVHEVLDLCTPTPDDLRELVKSRCATLRISYNSEAVNRAIDSADYQRVIAGKRPSDPHSAGAAKARLEQRPTEPTPV